MKVCELMSLPVITVRAQDRVAEAFAVVMNEGIFRPVFNRPVITPAVPPIIMEMGMINSPTSLELYWFFKKKPTKTAHREATPWTERSIPPSMIVMCNPMAILPESPQG